MSRSMVFTVAAGFVVGLALGCNSSKTGEASGAGGDPAQKPADPAKPISKDELSAAKAKLADLEKTIAAKEKELDGLRAEASALKALMAAAEGVTPLADLLGQLPKERWPKDASDTLRLAQANNWFKDNLVGRRATLKGLNAAGATFSTEKGGQFRVTFNSRPVPLKLYGNEWQVGVGSSAALDLSEPRITITFAVDERTAERVRSWPKDKLLEITFKIERAYFATDVIGRCVGINVIVEELAFKGIEQ